MLGTVVAHYRITGKIGEGGMGVVYRAEDTRLERFVALKFLNSGGMGESSRQRFLQEARSAARIQHPNVCPIFEVNEHAGQPFFAMAFVEGETVLQLVESGPLQPAKALDIAIQVLDGLEAAHLLGIVHRDIKSGNIVAGADGHATILDFGLALGPNSERLTMPGSTAGTAAYMSPEQARGLEVDRRSDIWSLSVTLFEMLTGSLPFRGDSVFGTMDAIVNQPPLAITALHPQVPEAVEEVVKKGLAKDPDQRFQSAMEMASALRNIRDAESRQTKIATTFPNAVQTSTLVHTTTQGVHRRSRWKLVAAAIGVALILAAAGAYFAFHKALPEQKQIAVLPFEIIGGQGDQAMRAMADGLVETLTAKLSQVEDFEGKLMVIPASEIRSRKITNAEQARTVYGANLAIIGSAQHWGDKIQFNEVLEDTATIRQLGSISFEVILDKATDIRDRAVEGALHLLQVKLMPAAVTALDAGETSTPGAYSEYLRGLGYLARFDVNGNVDRAIGSLEDAISADPRYALAFAALGEAQWRKAKLTSDKQFAATAVENIKHALQLDHRLTAARINLGEIYSESGQPELAISEEKSALQLAPKDARAYRALGTAYEALGRFGDAEEAFKKSIGCQPTDWYSSSLLGYFYVQRGRLTEAKTAYENALALTPDNEIVVRNIAALDMREGKFKQAVSLISKASAPDARTNALLGIAYYYQQQFREAAASLESSIKLAPDAYQVWGNLGTVYRHLPGREEKARQSFLKAIELAKKALEVQPGDFRAHANLAEYYAKLGELKQAAAELDRIPASARAPFVDRILLVYQFSGDTRRAAELAQSIPGNSPVLQFIKNDPDLASLWTRGH